MVIKFPKKKQAPSNKGKILEKAPQPFIDKISIVLPIKNDSLGQSIYADVFKTLDEKDTFADAKGAIWDEYRLGKRLVIPEAVAEKHYPLFQMAYAGKTATKIRVDFVPVDLGPKGMLALHALLITFLPDGWGMFADQGKITRLDVTMDFAEKSHQDFLFLPNKGATKTVWRSDGTLETYQSGKPKGNHTKLYDRKAKRIAKGSSWAGKEGIRLERVLKQPSVKRPADLYKLDNPFASMSLVRPLGDPPPGETKEYVWKLFNHAVEAVGLEKALALLPAHIRTHYKKHFERQPVDWWAPEASWSKWPTMLDELGIAKTNW